MSHYNTIHIFHFGTVQVIGKDTNIQTSITSVQTEAQAVIDNVWSKKPSDNNGTKEYHAINIFEGMFADWQPKVKGEKGFRTKIADLDSTLIDALAQAVKNTQPTPVTPQP
jgi:hypothetical protein